MKFGSITTGIIADGLVFNMDAANRASTIPISTVTTSFNTVDTSISGAFSDNGIFDSSTISPSFAFGGTDDDIEITANTNFNLIKYSFSFWIKNGVNTGIQVMGIFTCDSSTRGWLVYQRGAALQVDQAGVNSINSSLFFNSINTWIYASVTFDGTNTNVFRNSVLQNTFTSGGVLNSNGNIGLMGNNSYASGRYFNGNIGPFHVYNRALSASEVLHNYNALKSRFE